MSGPLIESLYGFGGLCAPVIPGVRFSRVAITKRSMTKKRAILLTLAVWLVGVSIYGYWYVTSSLAQPDLYGYERWPMFLILGFLVDRFIYLLFGLLVVLYAEVILFEIFFGRGRKPARES